MRSAAYIGRIGGLAIALGIGTAVATGYGVASADSTDSSSSSPAAHSAGRTSDAKATASRQQRATAARSGRNSASSLTAASTSTAEAAPAAPSKALSPNASRASSGGPVNDSPSAPVEPAPLWGLVSWARRESDVTANISAATTTQAAVTTSPVTTRVGWVTGPGTVTPSRFGIAGTDVGIMWDNSMTGANRQVLTIFGDTFSGANQTGVWRSDVLLRTTDPIARTFAPGSLTDPFAGFR